MAEQIFVGDLSKETIAAAKYLMVHGKLNAAAPKKIKS